VALGEATHGTHEFFQMKHRLLEFLVEEMDFTTFAIEASFAETNLVDAYVQGGEGSAEQMAGVMGYWTWDTQEVAELIDWMRAYNAGRDPSERIHFRGFDVQSTAQAHRDVLAYLEQVDPDAARAVRTDLNCAQQLNSTYGQKPDADQSQCRAALQGVYDGLAAHEAEYTARSSAEAFAFALRTMHVIQQAEIMYSADSIVIARDQSMAENVAWLLEQDGPAGRIVLWAHNGHVMTEPGSGSMGANLRQQFGEDLVSVGFATYQGQFNAYNLDFSAFYTYDALPAPPDSLEYTLRGADLPQFILDLHRVADDPAAAAWFGAPQPMRRVGAAYDASCPQSFFSLTELPLAHDVLIYFQQTTAADSLQRNPTRANTTAEDIMLGPSNLGFEDRSRCWNDYTRHNPAIAMTGPTAAVTASGHRASQRQSGRHGARFVPLGMLGSAFGSALSLKPARPPRARLLRAGTNITRWDTGTPAITSRLAGRRIGRALNW
jgi:erythromycin esterase